MNRVRGCCRLHAGAMALGLCIGTAFIPDGYIYPFFWGMVALALLEPYLT